MSRITISLVHAYQVLDSRGLPTIACVVGLSNGRMVKASVPSGTSTSPYEVPYRYDGSSTPLFGGKGVLVACNHINQILAPLVLDAEPDFMVLDARIGTVSHDADGKPIGANSLLALSMALVRAQACAQDVPLYQLVRSLLPSVSASTQMPLCIFNLINGGAHASNGFPVQECSIIPLQGDSMAEVLACATQVYEKLGVVLRMHGYTWTMGLEGGYAPTFKNTGFAQLSEAFALLQEAVVLAGFDATSVGYAVDTAASTWYDEATGLYTIGATTYTSAQLVAAYADFLRQYPLLVCEDPCSAQDQEGWRLFTQAYGQDMAVTGDDLTATDMVRIEQAVAEKLINSVLIKPNQVGTVSRALQAIATGQQAGLRIIVSHRSGETADSFVADLAVAAQAFFLKAGPPVHSERLAKYQRLIEIEQQIEGLLPKNYSD